MILILWILFFITTEFCYSIETDYKDRLFEDPGLVWLDNIDGVAYLQHIYIDSNLWKASIPPKPQSIARTRPDESLMTHLAHVNIDGNHTFVMTDSKTQRIMALTFDTFNHFTYHFWELYEGTSPKVNGIAVDAITNVVYWTDATYDVILAVSIELPNMAEVIIDQGLDEPFGIVTHPRKGYLFWTDASKSRPRLMRSSLGGKHVQLLVRFLDRTPSTLYIDYTKDRLYWLYVIKSPENKAGIHGIGTCDINGQEPKSYPTKNGNHFYSLDLFNEQLILVQRDINETGLQINKPKVYSADSGLHISTRGWSNCVLVLDPDRYRHTYNPCTNSLCPGICTRSLATEDCFCNEILKQSTDERTTRNYCDAKSFKGLLVPMNVGIFTMKTNFVEYKGSWYRSQMKPKMIYDGNMVRALTSDIRASKIFFYEDGQKVIKSVRTEDGNEAEVISLAIRRVRGLAFDGNSRNLYWTDDLLGHIMVTKEDGRFSYVLKRNLLRPRAIAVHPQKKLLFWSELGTRTVRSSYLDGSWYESYTMAKYVEIVGITIDFSKDRVFMCGETTLHVMDIDGGNFKNLTIQQTNKRHRFTGITILHDYLIVSDTHYENSGLLVFDKASVDDKELRHVGNTTYRGIPHGNWFGVTYHHISNQPDVLNYCEIKNLNCDQLCLPGHRNVTCVCGTGYTTAGNKCILDMPNKPFVLMVDQRYRRLFQIHALKRHLVDIPVQGIQQPYDIAYDPVQKLVYWSDLDAGTISHANLHGNNQEVIMYDPEMFYTDMAIEPGSRLLYYLVRARIQSPFQSASLAVYNMDTAKHIVLIDGALENPMDLAINMDYGYVYLTDHGNIWRVTVMNGTELKQLVTGIRSSNVATIGEYLYFSTTVSNPLGPRYKTLVRCSLDGDNATVLYEYIHSTMSSLAVDTSYIYWTNDSTKGVQRFPINGPYVLEDIGPKNVLIQPAGIFVNPIKDDYDSDCSTISCSGLCLPSPGGAVCIDGVSTYVVDIRPDNETAELCRLPNIQYGKVIGNEDNRVVPNGYKARVECFPAHKISRREPMICNHGQWSHEPKCDLDYDFCGTPERGYKIYRKNGEYFVYPQATKIDVILIGGGGGGYDDTNDVIVHNGKAANGSDSSFGEYLRAYGGSGGSFSRGGLGGEGHSRGGAGSVSESCTTGGTAGQAQAGKDGVPGVSYGLFSGAGGYSYECSNKETTETEPIYAGPGGKDSNLSSAGVFGGGAGSRGGGGSGGGGGWSRLSLNLPEKQLVPVTVGEAGYPSYGHPGPGIVVVMWGGYRADDLVNEYDVINKCVLN